MTCVSVTARGVSALVPLSIPLPRASSRPVLPRRGSVHRAAPAPVPDSTPSIFRKSPASRPHPVGPQSPAPCAGVDFGHVNARAQSRAGGRTRRSSVSTLRLCTFAAATDGGLRGPGLSWERPARVTCVQV